MKKIMLYALGFALLLANGVTAQQLRGIVSGTVRDGKQPLGFVNVAVKGTKIGTYSDEDGNYSLQVPEGMQELMFTTVGYQLKKQSVKVGSGRTTNLDIELTQDRIRMESVVVSATRQAVSRREAPSVVNVISPQLFDNTQSVVLADGLSYVPGLRVENNCQNCGFMQLRMNGLEGPYTQILMDSRPVFSGMNAVYGLEQLPTSMIEQVEVVRGGGSVLFGANAIGGTVNIITKEPKKNSFTLSTNSALVGNRSWDNSVNFNGSVVSKNHNAGLFIFGMHRNREGYNANPEDKWTDAAGTVRKDDFTEIPENRNNSMGFRAFYKPTDNGKFTLEFHTVEEYRRGGNKLGKQPHMADIAEQLNHDINGGALNYDWHSEDYVHTLNFYSSAQDTKRKSYYGAEQQMDAYGRSNSLSWVNGVQYHYDVQQLLFAPGKLTVGTEYLFSSLTDKKLGYRDFDKVKLQWVDVPGFTITDQESHTSGSFLQGEWKISRLKLLLGARYDRVVINDNHNGEADYTVDAINPRVNVLFDVTDEIQLRASYATGFRAPQMFDEDLHIDIAGARGIRHELSDDLEEETSRSYTLSLDHTYSYGGWQSYFLVEGFYTKLNNPFANVLDDTKKISVYKKVNAASGAVVKGVNVEASLSPVPQLSFQTGWTLQSSLYEEPQEWQDSENIGKEVVSYESRHILRTPDFYGSFSATYTPWESSSVSLSGVYTGSMKVPHLKGGYSNGQEITTNKLVSSKEFFDLGVKFTHDWDIKETLCIQLNFGVQNILNSYQSDFDAGVSRDSGYIYGPMRPRTYFLGLKFSNLF